MSPSRLLSLFLAILVIAVSQAVADVPVDVTENTPRSASPVSAQNVADLATAKVVAQRLRRMWPGNDVGILTTTGQVAANNDQDVHELVNHLNDKYSIYDSYNIADSIARRNPEKRADNELELNDEGRTNVEEDYISVFNNANTKSFNPKVDNPDNLEMMLSALWGKRYGNMNADQKDDAARNEKVLIIRGTSKDTERMSMGLSVDGSVQSFVARPDDVDVLKAEDPEAMKNTTEAAGPFKPKSYWYGPNVYGSALDITGHQVAANSTSREPSDPPKPPVPSYVFPEFEKNEHGDNTPVTIIETITVTQPKGNATLKPEATFTPIMTEDLKGKTEKPWTV
jgi:hypothetical protein|eukprot:TRINITY_DN112623_c0_g1_i1.p1 TRINITY_DN112623_c0_g1~~TRINITY_DN112623_c0_g1_i1.p1  ORF type:complete len:340 (-),score=77.17 TRINITY_DN112623_c0_g1_i1:77-1096(-)